MSNLWRNDTSRELGIFLSSPGAGYTQIADMPAGPLSAVVDWWRLLDLDGTESLWHPTLQTGEVETPAPPGVGGRGINILPRQYSSFTALPTVFKSASLAYSLEEGGRLSSKSLRITSIATDQWIAFSVGDWAWPIKLTPNKRWILSAYSRAQVVTVPYTITFSATETGSSSEYIEKAVATASTANLWSRQSVLFDLSTYAGAQGRLGFLLPSAGSIQLDAIMLEEQVGDTQSPSAFVDGVG